MLFLSKFNTFIDPLSSTDNNDSIPIAPSSPILFQYKLIVCNVKQLDNPSDRYFTPSPSILFSSR